MMSQRSRRELLTVVAPRYQQAQAAEREQILNEFVTSTGYHRKYAIQVLNHPPQPKNTRVKQPRASHYAPSVQHALVVCWRASNGICSKRLVPYLPELVSVLERHGELQVGESTRQQLLSLSPATADRLLKHERERFARRGLGTTTKPGTLLKDAIPIRTFADWDDAQAGFVEIDLVAHCGESTQGEYAHTLTFTDIATAWTECLALRNRGQQTVFAALLQARSHLPFPLLGLDADNGTEFINLNLLNYCRQEQITFTRSRPYKKNDQAHVEQKNWSIVRQLVGYHRYEGQGACDALESLYQVVRLYINFFQPSMKLVSKERVGSRLKKTYDGAKTPYQRVLESSHVDEASKERLRQEYAILNPVTLLQQIEQRQACLWKQAVVRFTREATIPSK